MSHDQSFRRKIIYIGAIVLLLFPLFWIGQPETRQQPGGILARLRNENNLSQANLGEIDPASESMKLATLGLRGVAANILWEKANEYKKKEDWVNLSATLNQITKLQPNFISVWEFQAHNLSYNISAEFDDYRYRYHWVKKGISFLADGIEANSENPRLLHNAGWITGQKIGRADEHVQFRELYREDTDFHDQLALQIPISDAKGYDARPDNWLTGRLWYLRAQQSDVPLKGKSPLIFYADAPMSLINYALTIEDEGRLGQDARIAWRDARKAWAEYGERPIPTSWGHNVRLGDYQRINNEIDKLQTALDELAPGAKDRLYEERVAELTDVQRAALDLTEDDLSEENYEDYYAALAAVKVTHEEVAAEAQEQDREKASALVTRILEAEVMSHRTSHYRGIVNYDYWEIRCEAEQTQTAIDARKFVYDAQEAQQDAALEKACGLYEKGWVEWRKIFDEYPRLMDDVAADDLMKSIQRYDRLLQQLDEDAPSDFPLMPFVEMRREKDDKVEELYRKLNQASQAAEGDTTDEVTGDTIDEASTESTGSEDDAAMAEDDARSDESDEAQTPDESDEAAPDDGDNSPVAEEMPAESADGDEQPAEPTDDAPVDAEQPADPPESSGESVEEPALGDSEPTEDPEGSESTTPDPAETPGEPVEEPAPADAGSSDGSDAPSPKVPPVESSSLRNNGLFPTGMPLFE